MFSPQLWNWVIGYQKQLAVGCHRLLFYKEERNKTALELARGQKYQHFLWSSPFWGHSETTLKRFWSLFFWATYLPLCLHFFNLPWCWKKFDTLWPLTHLFFVNTVFEWPPFLYRPGCDKMEKKLTIFGKKNNISYSLLKSTYLIGWNPKSSGYRNPLNFLLTTYSLHLKKPGSLM